MTSRDYDLVLKYIRVDPEYKFGLKRYTIHEIGLDVLNGHGVRREFFDEDVQRRVVLAYRDGMKPNIATRLWNSWTTIRDMRR